MKNTYDISFIIPAKNVSEYISEMLDSIIKIKHANWELIVIDDNSSDNTWDILEAYRKKHGNIRCYKNRKSGKVTALNEGFRHASGRMIKCIDADDVLSKEFYSYLPELLRHDVCCHDYYIVTEKLKKTAIYRMNNTFFRQPFEKVLKNLASLPRAVWSFTREIGEEIFPIPEALPYEDLWFSLIIKKNAGPIKYINEPLYCYRQHSNQTFGGVLNFDKKVASFRAERILQYIRYLEGRENFIKILNADGFAYQSLYQQTLKSLDISSPKIIFSDLRIADKIKLIVMKKLPGLFKIAKLVQWQFERVVK